MRLKCKLKVIFAERDIKQSVFAEEIGMSRTTLSSLVNNQSLPSLPNAYLIAEKLQLPVEKIWIRDIEDK